MNRGVWMCLAAVLAAPSGVTGQAVPDNSQARRVAMGYRRTPTFGVDPFRHVMIPHWGLVLTTGGTGGNNALNLRDLGALTFIDSNDTLRISDYVDALTLIPQGQGLLASGQVEGGAYLGMSLGNRFMLGLSVAGRAYGSFELDDDGIALLRDGNGARREFTLGSSHVAAMSTGDIGVHSVIRFGPLGSPDGVQLALGFGARNVRPALLLDARSLIENGGIVQATGDSISTNLAIEVLSTVSLGGEPNVDFWGDVLDRIRGDVGGSGNLVGDLLLRAEWPTSGIAIEGVLLNLGGKVGFGSVARRTDSLDIQTASLDSLREALDSIDFDIRDSVDVTRSLPRVARLGVSAWANRILQLDARATSSLGGDVPIPFTLDLVSTWRFARHLPLRVGVVVGGRQGIGYSGGFAVESRNFLFQVSGQSLGGFFKNATGVGGRFDFGFFF